MKKRFRYHVFYQFIDKNGNNGVGNCTFKSFMGSLNIKLFSEVIKDRHSFKTVIITGYNKL